MKEMNERLAMTEAQLDMTKDDLKVYKEMTHDLQKQVLILRNPPWTFSCGSHYAGIMATSKEISYSKLLYSSSNVEGAGLDISSGVFSAGYPGTYTATWSLQARDDTGDGFMDIYLRKNAKTIEESLHRSLYTGSEGYLADNGGRTMVLHLDTGDTLDLYCQDWSAGIYHFLCLSLSLMWSRVYWFLNVYNL